MSIGGFFKAIGKGVGRGVKVALNPNNIVKEFAAASAILDTAQKLHDSGAYTGGQDNINAARNGLNEAEIVMNVVIDAMNIINTAKK